MDNNLLRGLPNREPRGRGKVARVKRIAEAILAGGKRGRGSGLVHPGVRRGRANKKQQCNIDCYEDSTPNDCSQGRHNQDEEIYLNYGSDPDSEESDEEAVMPTFLPRAFRKMVDPMDGQFSESISDNFSNVDESYVAWEQPAVSIEIVSSEEASVAVTHEPSTFFNFQWKSFPFQPIPPESRRETFSHSNLGPTNPCTDPYDTFIAIWDHEIMEHIASETNRYAQQLAQQMLRNNDLRPHSRIGEWVDTNPDELYTYFAIVMAMGMVIKSRIEEYWCNAADIFGTPGFRAHMSLKRFQNLTKCLHFNNNEEIRDLELGVFETKLFKIQPVVTHLNKKFRSLYNMRQNLVIDELLLHWKDCFKKHLISDRQAAKIGIKTYEVCDAHTGYLWRFQVVAQKKSISNTTQSLEPLITSTPAIVVRLLNGLENKGHTVCMDESFSSPMLARRLKSFGFDCVGTLETNRQFVPEALRRLTQTQMLPNQVTGFTSGDVDVMLWNDQNKVAMISTYHGNYVTTSNGISKPTIISDYNTIMGGLDKKDQILATYPIERKGSRIWYKKFFCRLLNISIFNAHILVKQSSSSISHHKFRINLINSLLKKHSRHSSATTSPAIVTQKNKLTDLRIHHLAEYPFLPGRNGRLRRVCVMCKKRGHMYCVGCDKTVCLSPCFVSLHS